MSDVSLIAADIFVCFMAHSLGAFSILLTSVYLFGSRGLFAAPGIVIAAAIKEFWYDLRYELPKQTLEDSLLDFAGYMVGLGIAVFTVLLAQRYLGR